MTAPAKIIIFFVFFGLVAAIGGVLCGLAFIAGAAAQAWVVEGV